MECQVSDGVGKGKLQEGEQEFQAGSSEMEGEDIIVVECYEIGGKSGDGDDDIFEDVGRARMYEKKSRKVQELQPHVIMELMRLGGRDKSTIGIKNRSAEKQLSKMDPKHNENVFRIAKNIIVNKCKDFMPQDTTQLMYEVFSKLGCNIDSEKALKKCLTVCPERCIEKLLLRTVIHVVGIIGGRKDGKLLGLSRMNRRTRCSQ